MHRRPHLRLLAAGLVLACTPAAACSAPQGVEAAPAAGDPACARALDAAPQQVLGRARAPLDVAGALAWGEPAIVMRCGLAPLTPTTRVCLGIDGKDWVLDDSGDPRLLTTYGRDPAVEVRVPVELGPESGPAALVELAPVVDALPANGRTCS